MGKGWRRKAEALRGKRRPYRVLTRRASWSFTISRSLFKLVSVESVMPSNYLILCHPLLLLPILLHSVSHPEWTNRWGLMRASEIPLGPVLQADWPTHQAHVGVNPQNGIQANLHASLMTSIEVLRDWDRGWNAGCPPQG